MVHEPSAYVVYGARPSEAKLKAFNSLYRDVAVGDRESRSGSEVGSPVGVSRRRFRMVTTINQHSTSNEAFIHQ